MENDLDRWRRYGRCVTDEGISENRPQGRRHAARFCRAGAGVRQGSNPGPIPRQNDHPISDAFLTTSRFTSHNHASPTESRDAPMPAESTIDARSAIGQPDGGEGGI